MRNNYYLRFIAAAALTGAVLSGYGQNPGNTLQQKAGSRPVINNPAARSAVPGPSPFSIASAAPGITDYNDVQIFPSANEQAEVHISINRQNPSILLTSANTYVNNNYNQGRYVTTNSNITWTGADVLNANNPLVDGDPSTAIDANGNMFISTITETANGYYLTSSANNGANFGNLVQGVAQAAGTFDKEMIVADNTPGSPNINNLYAAWSTILANGTETVVFNRSLNGGVNFTAPITLKNGPGQGANVQTGPNGEVYVCYADYGAGVTPVYPAGGLGFVRSVDGGVTFTAARVAVNYTGIRKTGGGVDGAYNNIGVNDFPSMAVDKSHQAHNGRIYAVFAAQQNGNGKGVIELTHSDDQGNTWTAPAVISISNASESFFPWVCVDQLTGGLYIAYFAIDGGGFQTNTYVAISNDGGNTIITQKVSDVSHVTQPINNAIHRTGYEGDYIGIAAHAGKAYAAWMDERNGHWQIYVSEVDNVPVITGPQAFCSTASYSLSNFPPGATIAWSVTPTGVVNVPANGNPITVSKVSQGYATLTATVNGVQTVSYNITTVPTVSSISATMNGGCTNGIQTWLVSATANMAGATNWNWTVDNPSSGIFIYNSSSPSTFMDVTRGGGVSVTFKDACGETSGRNGVTIYNPCGPRSFVVSPNPATATVIVAAAKTTITARSGSTISEINVYDIQGILIKHILYHKTPAATLDVADLRPGLYVIEVVDGMYREKQKLQVVK